MELRVVKSHAYHCLHLLLSKRYEACVVVSFVSAAYDPYYRSGLTFKCVPCGIHIGCLRIVYIEYILDAQNLLEPVLDSLEGGKTVSDGLVVYVHDLGCNCGCHRVVNVVLSAEGKLLKIHVALVLLVADDHPVILHECSLSNFFLLGERKFLGLHHDLVEMPDGDLVVRTEDEAVVA